MTKSQYISLKTYNPLDIVYHYYLNHENRKHNPLPPDQLFLYLQTRGWNMNQITARIFEEYDAKFEIVALLDKNGNVIKYL